MDSYSAVSLYNKRLHGGFVHHVDTLFRTEGKDTLLWQLPLKMEGKLVSALLCVLLMISYHADNCAAFLPSGGRSIIGRKLEVTPHLALHVTLMSQVKLFPVKEIHKVDRK